VTHAEIDESLFVGAAMHQPVGHGRRQDGVVGEAAVMPEEIEVLRPRWKFEFIGPADNVTADCTKHSRIPFKALYPSSQLKD
jgi:hypothetical protein